MIKVNSKVFIKGLVENSIDGLIEPPTMIVEGFANIKIHPDYQAYNKCAKCIWYNTKNELQSEFINLEILTEL